MREHNVSASRRMLKHALDRGGLRWMLGSLQSLDRRILTARTRTAAERLKQVLDRRGFRWLLGALMTRSHDVRALGVTRVFRRRGTWIHQFRDGYVLVEDVDSALPTVTVLDEQTRETWERTYTPRSGDVVVDIGAGTGTEVLRWSRAVGPTGRVIAVEALPRTYSHLRLFCTLNGLANVQPLNLAISDTSGAVAIEDSNDYLFANIVGGRGTVSVNSVTLDQLLTDARVDAVDYLKMNIEGAETAALRGMASSSSRIKRMCISCHDFRADWGHGEYFRTKIDVAHLLETRGFRVEMHPPDECPWIRDQVSAFRDDRL